MPPTKGSNVNLTYVYDNGNRLTKVTDAGATAGFNNGSSADTEDYKYDGNGNMVQDKSRGIADGAPRYSFRTDRRNVTEWRQSVARYAVRHDQSDALG